MLKGIPASAVRMWFLGIPWPSKRATQGPSTQYSRTLVPNTFKGMVFGTRVLKYWLLGPSGFARTPESDKDQGAHTDVLAVGLWRFFSFSLRAPCRCEV